MIWAPQLSYNDPQSTPTLIISSYDRHTAMGCMYIDCCHRFPYLGFCELTNFCLSFPSSPLVSLFGTWLSEEGPRRSLFRSSYGKHCGQLSLCVWHHCVTKPQFEKRGLMMRVPLGRSYRNRMERVAFGLCELRGCIKRS